MNAAAQRFAGQGVGSIFLYSFEAHPGENYPHLTSLEQKFRHAAALRDQVGVNRPILVDSLDGVCHRAYGSMPNMTWIFDRSGRVLYKADWSISWRSANAAKAMNGLLPSGWSGWNTGMWTGRRSMTGWRRMDQRRLRNS